jgi:hypothetical protein
MKKPPPEPGIYPNVPMSEYAAWDALNHSALKWFDHSPAHVKRVLDGAEFEPSDAMEFGSAVHAWVLERERYAEVVALRPDFEGKGSKAERAAWESTNAHKVQIPFDRQADVEAVGRVIMADPNCRRLARNPGHRECCLVWDDNGVRCKGRCDKFYHTLGMALDLKTTKDASPTKFARGIVDYGYASQAAFYTRGLAALGVTLTKFYILAVENEAPFGAAVYTLDDEFMRIGRTQVALWMQQAAACFKSGEWPGYPSGVVSLSPPAWWAKQWEGMEVAV